MKAITGGNYLFGALLALVLSCGNSGVRRDNRPASGADTLQVVPAVVESGKPEKSELALYLESLGLVDVRQLDSAVLVEIKYATAANFTGRILYPSLHQAYLQPDVAVKLSAAQRLLNRTGGGYRLLVYDAARPLSVQQTMWESVQGTPYSRYVADPERTSLHNYGAAVDLTVVDSLLVPLDMGTPFDYFGKKAGINREDSLVAAGALTLQQVGNRKLLRNVMRQAGFLPVGGEWWHFNACTLKEAKERYRIIE